MPVATTSAIFQATHCLQNAQRVEVRGRVLRFSFAPPSSGGQTQQPHQARASNEYASGGLPQQPQPTPVGFSLANPSPTYASGETGATSTAGGVLDVAAYAAHARNKPKAKWPNPFEVRAW